MPVSLICKTICGLRVFWNKEYGTVARALFLDDVSWVPPFTFKFRHHKVKRRYSVVFCPVLKSGILWAAVKAAETSACFPLWPPCGKFPCSRNHFSGAGRYMTDSDRAVYGSKSSAESAEPSIIHEDGVCRLPTLLLLPVICKWQPQGFCRACRELKFKFLLKDQKDLNTASNVLVPWPLQYIVQCPNRINSGMVLKESMAPTL